MIIFFYEYFSWKWSAHQKYWLLLVDSSIINISGLGSDQQTNQVPMSGKIKAEQRTYLCHCVSPSFINIINAVCSVGASKNVKKGLL